jgi:protein-tyrosine-phosphatase
MLQMPVSLARANAGRSQMVEAFAKVYREGRIEAMSAGTMPAQEVNPIVVSARRSSSEFL